MSKAEVYVEMLKSLRKSKGVSQDTLSELSGVSPKTIRNWEQGKAVPVLESFIACCNALDHHVEVLPDDYDVFEGGE